MMAENKTKFMNLKNFIKQENGRLSSLTSPRDLSLGGSKKKVYTPNLNVVRSKTKVSPAIVKAQRENRRNVAKQFTRNQNNGRFVQSSGVFSEGAAEIRRPTLYSDKHSAVREAETSSGMIKPKLGNDWNIDLKEEEAVVTDLLKHDEDDRFEVQTEYEPIILPLAANEKGFINHFKVKQELDDKSDIIKIETDYTQPVKEEKCDYLESTSSFKTENTFDDDRVSVSLVKFPDSMPGRGYDDADTVVDFTLGKMIEGQIGKICIRQSGKTEIIIGKTTYTLDEVEAAQYKEEVMCLPHMDNLHPRQGLSSLGCINEKFVISPQWLHLLNGHGKLK